MSAKTVVVDLELEPVITVPIGMNPKFVKPVVPETKRVQYNVPLGVSEYAPKRKEHN